MPSANEQQPATIGRRYVEEFAVRKKDARSMDEICRSGNGGKQSDFELQVQQRFLREYVSTNAAWRRLLLYHKIGSGKTCTAITVAEACLARGLAPRGVVVILPARLKTNFADELLSACPGRFKYVTAGEAAEMASPGTSMKRKKEIARACEARYGESYTLMSFEGLAAQARAAGASLGDWARDFTRDRLVIVDEVHNLFSTDYDRNAFARLLKTEDLTSVAISRGTHAVFFQFLARKAHESCRMLFLTATPVFDRISQIRELAFALDPGARITGVTRLKEAADVLRGKVSYFPGTGASAYPEVATVVHPVAMSKTQDGILTALQENEEGGARRRKHDEEDEDDTLTEMFMARQRQASIACLPGLYTEFSSVAGRAGAVVADLAEHAPKVKKFLELLESLPGKHLVYSSFVECGTRVVEEALRRLGWISAQEAAPHLFSGDNNRKKEKNNMKKREDAKSAIINKKVYATWTGDLHDGDKQALKALINSPADNLDGARVRVIIGSPSIKEGVSFLHVQHMHILDPVWNSSAMAQVEGRAVRLCSHSDIPRDHPSLRRRVVVHCYRLVPTRASETRVTPDMVIYDHIIPRKRERIEKAERLLRRVAIDYPLFKALHENGGRPPGLFADDANGDISLIKDRRAKRNQKKSLKVKVNSTGNATGSRTRQKLENKMEKKMENKMEKRKKEDQLREKDKNGKNQKKTAASGLFTKVWKKIKKLAKK
jgi:hypothetical protein